MVECVIPAAAEFPQGRRFKSGTPHLLLLLSTWRGWTYPGSATSVDELVWCEAYTVRLLRFVLECIDIYCYLLHYSSAARSISPRLAARPAPLDIYLFEEAGPAYVQLSTADQFVDSWVHPLPAFSISITDTFQD